MSAQIGFLDVLCPPNLWIPNEPTHDKTNKMNFAPSKLSPAWASAQSDQSLCCLREETLGRQLPIERTAKIDQTGQMPRLLGVCARRTDHFVGFVMSWFK